MFTSSGPIHIAPSNVLEYCSEFIRSGMASTSNSPGSTKHGNEKLEHNASENQEFDQ